MFLSVWRVCACRNEVSAVSHLALSGFPVTCLLWLDLALPDYSALGLHCLEEWDRCPYLCLEEEWGCLCAWNKP